MARSPNSPVAAAGTAAKQNLLLELDRFLGRLDQSILKATAEQERRLRRDEFERTKVRFDIETARTLLTGSEKDSLAIKVVSRRQELQAELVRKRELIEQLLERVQDLEDIGLEDDDSGSEGEDILADIILTPSESMDSRSAGGPGESASDGAADGEAETENSSSSEPPPPAGEEPAASFADGQRRRPFGSPVSEVPGTATSQTMRSRASRYHDERERDMDNDTAQTTSASTRLFESSKAASSLSATATEEAILDLHRKEQEALSDDILRMATELKTKSLSTSRLLEQDKDVLSRVGESLDTTDRNMESAGRRMSTLSKLTEGRGWWGRMLLFAMVYGMMALLVLMFLLLPKLRF